MMIEGMLLGMAYVLPPGPVTAETVRRSLHGGISAALAVQLGAIGGDLIYAILVMAGIGTILTHAAVRSGIDVLGAVLLLYLGVSALQGWGAGASQDQIPPDRLLYAHTSLWRQARVGFIVSLMNPFAAGFWMTVGSIAIESSSSWLAGFLLGSLLASLLTGIVAGLCSGQYAARYARWVSFGCGCVLIALSLRLWCTMPGMRWLFP